MVDYRPVVTKISTSLRRPMIPERSGPPSPAAGRLRLMPELTVLLLFVLFSIAMTWPLATGLSDRLISWGDPVFQAWTMAWDVHAWRTDPLDIFNANIFYPYRNTLAYSDFLFGQALLVAPVLLLTENPILADNLATLMAFVMSGFAMYLLVFDLTGSRLAGLVAGFAYAFVPARMAHLEHLHLISAAWLPLALLALRRALRERSLPWAAALGVIVALQGLFGIYYLYFMFVLLGVVLAVYLIARPSRDGLIAVGQIVAACLVAGLLLVPILLPYQRVHDDLGIERTETEVSAWSARPQDYLAVSPRNRLYGGSLGERFSRHLETELFPGALLLLLAVVGLFSRRLGWERAALAALVVVALVLSFGLYAKLGDTRIPLPYRIPYDLMPGFRAIRVPARLALLMVVGLSTLAGLGVDLILRRWLPRLPMSWSAQFGGVAVVTLLLIGLFAEYSTRVPLPDPLPTTLAAANRADYAWMAANPAPSIEFPMGDGPVASAWPNFWSTLHWNVVVNGYSGLTPPAYYPFRDQMRQFPSPETVSLLQGIGVETVVYHSDPAVSPDDDSFLRRMAAFPQLEQVVGAPDYVFQLAPDPWIWELGHTLPDGSAVNLPLVEQDPSLFGMLAAVLQRQGHRVYGSGVIDYWELPAAPAVACHLMLPVGTSPESAGFADADLVEQAGRLALYRRSGCASE